MAGEEESEKPFEATPRKLEEARKRGEFPVSQDLVNFSVYLSIVVLFPISGAWTLEYAGTSLIPFIDNPDILAEEVFSINGRLSITTLIFSFSLSISLWLIFPLVSALLSSYFQGAMRLSVKKLRPKLSRISPLHNAKQKYGPDGLFNFFKSFLKLVIYCCVLGVIFHSYIEEIISTPALSVVGNLKLIAKFCLNFLIAACITIFGFAVIDFLWQRSQFLRRQRMSLKELRDENKETEGDPHTKQVRKQKAYDIATNQMLLEVPQADVVVVNPEHYAIALQWDRSKGTAPVCVAKGVDEVATRIKEIANSNGVPIYRDPPTARAIFSIVGLGDEIPVDYYRAIASAIRFADMIRLKSRAR